MARNSTKIFAYKRNINKYAWIKIQAFNRRLGKSTSKHFMADNILYLLNIFPADAFAKSARRPVETLRVINAINTFTFIAWMCIDKYKHEPALSTNTDDEKYEEI